MIESPNQSLMVEGGRSLFFLVIVFMALIS
jgi:hypothetical protein